MVMLLFMMCWCWYVMMLTLLFVDSQFTQATFWLFFSSILTTRFNRYTEFSYFQCLSVIINLTNFLFNFDERERPRRNRSLRPKHALKKLWKFHQRIACVNLGICLLLLFVVCFVEISCILFCWNLSASVADVWYWWVGSRVVSVTVFLLSRGCCNHCVRYSSDGCLFCVDLWSVDVLYVIFNELCVYVVLHAGNTHAKLH